VSVVTQVKLRDGTYVSAMECVRNGDWPTIERAFTELYEELQAARRTVSGQEAIGEVKDHGVQWFDQNPHAYPVGTKFYTVPREAHQPAVAWLVTSKREMIRCVWTEPPSKEQLILSEFDGDKITPLYAAPIPATERVAEPEAKAWAAARSMGCADWIKEWVPQLEKKSESS
jgi:hypothetical protein